MSLILNLIKTDPHWKKTLQNKDIKITRKGNLASFNYGRDADFTDPIVCEARGLILNTKTKKVVCFPFRKFGNYGESYADEIDWKSARVQEKIDGSIIKAYFHNRKWCIATNATVDANEALAGSSERSFGELFYEAAENQHLDWNLLDKNCTYMFELTSPESRVVIDYGNTPKIWHIGTRNNITEEEIETDIGIIKPTQYPLGDLASCIEAANNINNTKESIENEGFVVVDKDYHRIKIKSPEYVFIHHILPNGAVSDETLVSAIRSGSSDDIEAYRPDVAPRIIYLRKGMRDIQQRLNRYTKYWSKQINKRNLSRKDFALLEKHSPYFSFCISTIFSEEKCMPTIDDIRTPKLVELINNRPTLTVLVGLPGSGKTHYAVHEMADHKHISSDAIRKETLGSEEDQSDNAKVFRIMEQRVREAIIGGESVVADATNVSMRSRKTWQQAMNYAYKTEAIVIATPVPCCVRNDDARERHAGHVAIYKAITSFEIPLEAEGFDKVTFIRKPFHTFGPETMSKILESMKDFDQSSKWHTEDLMTHTVNAWLYFSETHSLKSDCTAAMLHDIGKLRTRKYDEHGAHFYHHANVGAYEVLSVYDFPNYSEEELKKILMLICYHDKVIHMKQDKILNMFGKENADYLLDFRKADESAAVRANTETSNHPTKENHNESKHKKKLFRNKFFFHA